MSTAANSTKTRWERCKVFVGGPRFKLYCSYALSTWGDRLWTFALSLALYKIADNLRLTAISGFVDGLCVLVFGAAVGKAIDHSRRINAARVTLIVNNLSVLLSAIALIALIQWRDQINQLASIALITVAIGFAALSVLASTGNKIVVTKDWVVVMCRDEKDKLADTNAMLLRIDLTAMILSPLIAGQLMTSFSMVAGCLFIAGWNLCSFWVEYYLLVAIHSAVPALQSKRRDSRVDGVDSTTIEANKTGVQAQEMTSTGINARSTQDASQHEAVSTGSGSRRSSPERRVHPISNAVEVNGSSSDDACTPREIDVTTDVVDKRATEPTPTVRVNEKGGWWCGCTQWGFCQGWTTYWRNVTFPAALGLGLLYLTVMGLDGITTGYAYSQGLQENVLAVVRGFGALVGISGSFAFPIFRSRIGLPRTGLIALSLQLLMLSLSVASIWLPGSPFDPVGYWRTLFVAQKAAENSTDVIGNLTTTPMSLLSTQGATTTARAIAHDSWISIWAFLTGLVLARFGLWMADLSISQIMQEEIREEERGVVNGVQSSIQRLMDLLKNVLVIVLPEPQTFGLLIVVSFCSVACAFVSYAVYCKKVRGHVLPFHNVSLRRFVNRASLTVH